MGRKAHRKLYVFVDALVATGVRELVRAFGIDEGAARDVMIAISGDICDQFVRQIIYVPADLERRRAKRDESIWSEYGQDGPDGSRKFSPSRVAQIAEKYELTSAQVYCILRVMRQRDMASRQSDLPGIDPIT